MSANTAREFCTPYICEAGACLRDCQSNAECAEDYECNDGACEEVAASSTDEPTMTMSRPDAGSGASGTDSSAGSGGDERDGTDPASDGGGCSVTNGKSSAPTTPLGLLVALGVFGCARRRRAA